jgi:hypothetical protein
MSKQINPDCESGSFGNEYERTKFNTGCVSMSNDVEIVSRISGDLLPEQPSFVYEFHSGSSQLSSLGLISNPRARISSTLEG